MPDATYDGSLGYPFGFIFTPISGAAFGSAQAQGEKISTAKLKRNTPKFTPVTGSNAGNEQFVIANIPTSEMSVTWTYNKAAYQAALACFVAGIKGTLVNTRSDGAVETWTGAALTEVSPGDVEGQSLQTGTLMFMLQGTPTVA